MLLGALGLLLVGAYVLLERRQLLARRRTLGAGVEMRLHRAAIGAAQLVEIRETVK